MAANKSSTTVPIREEDAHVARLAATHSGKSLVDYSSKLLGEHSRKFLDKLGVPYPGSNSTAKVSKS